jgi:hypothetical protein
MSCSWCPADWVSGLGLTVGAPDRVRLTFVLKATIIEADALVIASVELYKD